MSLSNELISQFVKATADERETSKETTVYGTTIEANGKIWVKLDGSDVLTPISTTTAVKPDERVTVMIKDHTATITGNISSPSARTGDVDDVDKKVDSEVDRLNQGLSSVSASVETLEADNVTIHGALEANSADIGTLKADNVTIRGELNAAAANIETLQATDVTITGKLEAAEAEIDHLKADKLDVDIADITYATIENLEATNAEVYNLSATHAEFQTATAKNFEAANAEIETLKANDVTITGKLETAEAEIEHVKADKLDADAADIKFATIDNLNAATADISKLKTDKLDATTAEITYATLDFANIGEAAIQKIFAGTGLIKDLVVGNQTVTGEIVGVTISGDLIKANTLKADKLVVKGSDGIYYKLNVEAGAVASTEVSEEDLQNGLHGSNIIAKTITAEKIAVNDLVAFGATIGGYHMTDDSLYSGTKESISNTTPGVYFGSDGQFAVGNSGNYLKFYKKSDGTYILEVAASSVIFGASGQNVEDALSGISTRVDTTDENLGNLGTRIETAENSIGTLTDTTEGLGTRVDTAEGNISTLNSTTEGLGTRVDTAEGNIGTLGTRVDTAEGNIGTLNTTTESLGTRVDTAEGNIGTLTETTEGLGTRVETAEGNIGDLTETTGDLSTRVEGSETSINDLNDLTSTLDTQIDDMEGDIADLNSTTDELGERLDETNGTLDTVQDEIGAVKDSVSGILMDIEALTKNAEYIYIGSYNGEPCIELGERDSDFKVIITNTKILFAEGSSLPAYITNKSLHINKAVIEEDLQQGGFVWKARPNGNLGLMWRGVNE